MHCLYAWRLLFEPTVYNDIYDELAYFLHSSILIVNCSVLHFVSGFRYGVRS